MKKIFARLALIAALLLSAFPAPAVASQGSGCMPTSGTLSGLTLVQLINAANKAFITQNSGATAPATDCSGLAQYGQPWLDTSLNSLKVYDGASWLTTGVIDATNHWWQPVVGGGLGTVVSATTTDLWSVAPASVQVTGTTTITALANSSAVPGTIKVVRFAAALTLTHNATSLILPGGQNITTAAGDSAVVLALTATNVQVLSYSKASGAAVATTSVFTGSVFFQQPITPSALTTTTNDWNPTGLSTANVIRVSATGAQTITGITAAGDGKLLDIYNIGTTSITLLNESASSSAANRFSIPATFELRSGASVSIIYDGTAARWKLFNEGAGDPVTGSWKNLKVVNDPANALTNMAITADQIVAQDIYGRVKRLSNISVSPSVLSSGANGLDTGAVTSGAWYYLYVIYNPTTNASAGLISLQSTCTGIFTAPSMPSGYTFCARVASNKTNGSSRWFGILKYDNSVQYVLGLAGTSSQVFIATYGAYGSTTTPTWQAFTVVGNQVPPVATRIKLFVAVWPGSTNSASIAAPNANYGGDGSTTNPPFMSAGASSAAGTNTRSQVTATMTLEANTIQFASSGGFLICQGWEE